MGRLPAPGQSLQRCPAHSGTRHSDIPTVLPATGAQLVRSVGVHSPPHAAQPRQWGILPLLQQAGGAPPGGAAQQQQQQVSAPPGRAVLQQHRGGSHAGAAPAAAAKPRGFQGQLQNRRPRGNAGASQQQAAGARRAAGGAGAAAQGGLKAKFGRLQQAKATSEPSHPAAPDMQNGRKRAGSRGPEEATADPPAEGRRSPPAQQPTPLDEIECLPSARKGPSSSLERMPSGEAPVWHVKGRAAKQQRQLLERGQRSLGSRAAGGSTGSGQKLCLMPTAAPTPLQPQHAAGQPAPAAPPHEPASGAGRQQYGSPAAAASGLQLRLVARAADALQQLHPDSSPAADQPSFAGCEELPGLPIRAASQPAQPYAAAAPFSPPASPAAADASEAGAPPGPPLLPESELATGLPHAHMQPHSYVPETCMSVYGLGGPSDSVPDTPDGKPGSSPASGERRGSQDSAGCVTQPEPARSQEQQQQQGELQPPCKGQAIGRQEAGDAAVGGGERVLSQSGQQLGRRQECAMEGGGDRAGAPEGRLSPPDSCPAAMDQNEQDRSCRELRMSFGTPVLAAVPSTSGRSVLLLQKAQRAALKPWVKTLLERNIICHSVAGWWLCAWRSMAPPAASRSGECPCQDSRRRAWAASPACSATAAWRTFSCSTALPSLLWGGKRLTP